MRTFHQSSRQLRQLPGINKQVCQFLGYIWVPFGYPFNSHRHPSPQKEQTHTTKPANSKVMVPRAPRLGCDTWAVR